MNLKGLTVGALLAAVPTALSAHEAGKGPNGGPVADSKGHHVEFVKSTQEIVLYLTDEAEKPIATKGSTGRAIIQDSGRQATVPLSPAEPNRLIGKLEAPLSSSAKVVVSATLPDGHSVQARFTAE